MIEDDSKLTRTQQGAMLVAAIKGWDVWEVTIKNNFRRTSNYEYCTVSYPVIASSADEAVDTLLRYNDLVLEHLLSKRIWNGKRLLGKKNHLPIERRFIGKAYKGSERFKRCTISTMRILTPEGYKQGELAYGHLVMIEDIDTALQDGQVAV